ncbi:MAG: hypothetical protein LBR95_08115 [Azoarcus sp.]|nr:hypothetical protein [Azoarcus sp.]
MKSRYCIRVRLHGDTGNDLLCGGEGSDIYFFSPGSRLGQRHRLRYGRHGLGGDVIAGVAK